MLLYYLFIITFFLCIPYIERMKHCFVFFSFVFLSYPWNFVFDVGILLLLTLEIFHGLFPLSLGSCPNLSSLLARGQGQWMAGLSSGREICWALINKTNFPFCWPRIFEAQSIYWFRAFVFLDPTSPSPILLITKTNSLYNLTEYLQNSRNIFCKHIWTRKASVYFA